MDKNPNDTVDDKIASVFSATHAELIGISITTPWNKVSTTQTQTTSLARCYSGLPICFVIRMLFRFAHLAPDQLNFL